MQISPFCAFPSIFSSCLLPHPKSMLPNKSQYGRI
ncbi:hypothetical protein NEOC95_002274 [Neochlamydia sp. AcF95]|nr:hypothetical protein [Neochlamydia sp. AcF95]